MSPKRLRLHAPLALLALLALPMGVQAQSADELRALMPGLPIKASGGSNLTLGGDFRQSEFTATKTGFELRLHWNGIDDEDWPFEKIVSAIASRNCGAVSADTVNDQVERLYKTKSLIRGRDLGGNAGETFKKRMSAKLGACNVTYLAEGARWHTLTATVSKR